MKGFAANKRMLTQKEMVISGILAEMKKQNISKKDLSVKAGISRPTLDKFLNGETESEQAFMKYFKKIVESLEMFIPSWNEDREKRLHNYFAFKVIRDVLGSRVDDKLHECGLTKEDIEELFDGISLPANKMRAAAMALGVGYNDLLDNCYFPPVVSARILDFDAKNKGLHTLLNEVPNLNTYWGYVYISLRDSAKHLLHPISSYAKSVLDTSNGTGFIAFPCMDDVLLVLNMEQVDEIELVPEFVDYSVSTFYGRLSESEQEEFNRKMYMKSMPPVVYDSFEDYFSMKDYAENFLNKKSHYAEYMEEDALKQMDCYMRHLKYDLNTWKELEQARVFFRDGKQSNYQLSMDAGETQLSLIRAIYSITEYGEMPIRMFGFETKSWDKGKGIPQDYVCLPAQNVSAMYLPLHLMNVSLYDELCSDTNFEKKS